MQKYIYILLGILTPVFATAQQIAPIHKSVGKLNISIDPRMELLGAIQTVADYPLVTQGTPYSNEVKSYFAATKGAKAVLMTKELQNQGFSYDAPASFMLYLSQPCQLKKTTPYSDYLIKRAGGEESLNRYREAISEFANTSNFVKFWESNKEFYNKSLELTCAELKDIDPVKTIEAYYRDSRSSYHIIVCPLFGKHSYGAEIAYDNGQSDIYALTCASNTKDGIPYLNKENVEYLVLHEFSHSFVNQLTEKHSDRVELTNKLFEPIKDVMSKMAYGTWETVLNEHIIRAVTIRMTENLYGENAATSLRNREKQQGFIYIDAIIEKLKEYEKERDANEITFADYFPRILSALETLNPGEITFTGNINNVFNANKLAIIYPTAGNDTQMMDSTKQYVNTIAKFIGKKLNKEYLLLADTTALNTPLGEYAILCYGTMESNLFLSSCKDMLPFRVKNSVLLADKEYPNPELRLITCIPNPQNKKNGMIIYTALKDENIININNFTHGMRDYHIFDKDKTVLSEGDYKKESTPWQF